jgi:CheY-like chemotaxis protein
MTDATGTDNGRTLLLVDDDRNTRIAIGDFLRFRINGQLSSLDVVCNGQEALNFVQETRPHVVLMDVQMPVMDGITASRAMRADGYLGHIILYSNHNFSPDKLQPAQATDFFYDKTRRDQLAATIRAYLLRPHQH